MATDDPGAGSPRKAKGRARPPKVVVGWREWVRLPDLADDRIKAKIDTGARTSALHAFRLAPLERDGETWVRFELHPEQRSLKSATSCEARVIDRRRIRSSSGQAEWRYVIETTLEMAGMRWPIEVSLARRDEMGFRMILGRTALRRRLLVDPGKAFLTEK